MANKKPADKIVRVFNLGSGLVSVCAAVLAAILILYSGYVLYDSMAIQVSAFSSNSDLLKYKPGVLKDPPEDNGDDEPSLESINKDYRAWITVKDSPIDYPIVQGKDDLYYASHDVYNNVSLTGAIYLAAANTPNFSDSYNLLYGHHMDNGAMFGSLDKFQDAEYFKEHQTAVLTTKSGDIYDVTFFAVALTDAYEKQIYTVGNRAKQVISFLSGNRNNDAGVGTNVLIFDAAVARNSYKVIALSTCANANTNGRLVVFGRMVKRKTNQNQVILTVKFHDPDGNEVFPDQVLVYEEGDKYYVVAPQKPGYDVDIRIVKGTITEDMVVIVTYTPRPTLLRIRYRLPDGSVAAPDYDAMILTGEDYEIISPVIEGYKAVIVKVAGEKQGRDEYYTVIYVPEDYEDYRDMDDYATPANLGETYIQIGVCTE